MKKTKKTLPPTPEQKAKILKLTTGYVPKRVEPEKPDFEQELKYITCCYGFWPHCSIGLKRFGSREK